MNKIQFTDTHTVGNITYIKHGLFHITIRPNKKIEVMKLGTLSQITNTHPIIYYKYFDSMEQVTNLIAESK